ncbi:adenylate/guanylate cyclase domain-containing protein [Aestuariibacter halophilus]|uniref:Adenylate/guanylate cyclase domain-containing protein n=1 Tax=Fluctibacter halophilus TaxID=226011 RepID=A0ABS8G402_9ALTE|nr:adenylate/guanylate cyclase domain-containing protein [Aestuariibacter halophilus]MCC2615329.1 adenylate/guanylate cyclase domain-containing protein [Aestuariibacter halophilus]
MRQTPLAQQRRAFLFHFSGSLLLVSCALGWLTLTNNVGHPGTAFLLLFSALFVLIINPSWSPPQQRAQRFAPGTGDVSVTPQLHCHLNTTTPRTHGAVTVLFADLQGFTRYCRSRPPEQVLGDLDMLFKGYDFITSLCQMDKVKTAGDQYMAAAGLNNAQPLNPLQASHCAWLMRDYAVWWAANINAPLQVRIGLATGAAISGMLGHTDKCLDVWGNTINIAARMEQLAPANHILLHSSTANAVRRYCQLSARQTLFPKGLPTQSGYYLEKLTTLCTHCTTLIVNPSYATTGKSHRLF